MSIREISRKMSIKPIHDNVAIEVIENEATTAGGIVLTSSAAPEKNTGIVVAIGNGRLLTNGERAAMSVNVGDKVAFSHVHRSTFKLDDGRDVIVIPESNILAIL